MVLMQSATDLWLLFGHMIPKVRLELKLQRSQNIGSLQQVPFNRVGQLHAVMVHKPRHIICIELALWNNHLICNLSKLS